MATKLKRLVIDRVDLVDKGANPDAYVVLYKRDDVAKASAVCSDCGTETEPYSEYCPGCGESMMPMAMADMVRCMKCAAPMAKSANFCKQCGTRRSGDMAKAQWTAAYINTLPDSSFAVIEPGAEKDAGGKTTPRSKRHLPYKDADGKVDLPHLRNALARLPQTQLSADLKAKAQRVLEAAAQRAGVGKGADVTEQEAQELKKRADEQAAEIAALRKRAEDAETQTAEALAIAKRAQDDQARVQYIEKMRLDFRHLPVKPTEDWRVLKALDALAAQEDHKAAAERLMDLLKAYDAMCEQGSTFKRLGHSANDPGVSGTAEARIYELANQLVTKGDYKTKADALAYIANEYPALYAEYAREQRVRVTGEAD